MTSSVYTLVTHHILKKRTRTGIWGWVGSGGSQLGVPLGTTDWFLSHQTWYQFQKMKGHVCTWVTFRVSSKRNCLESTATFQAWKISGTRNTFMPCSENLLCLALQVAATYKVLLCILLPTEALMNLRPLTLHSISVPCSSPSVLGISVSYGSQWAFDLFVQLFYIPWLSCKQVWFQQVIIHFNWALHSVNAQQEKHVWILSLRTLMSHKSLGRGCDLRTSGLQTSLAGWDRHLTRQYLTWWWSWKVRWTAIHFYGKK